MRRVLVLIGLVAAGWSHLAGEPRGPATSAPSAAAVRRLPNSVRVTRSSGLASLTPSAQEYTVVCSLVSDPESKNNVTFSTPPVTLRDGERATLSDTAESRFVIAHKAEAGGKTPITRTVSEGTTFDICVLGLGDDTVVLDVTAEFQAARQNASEQPQSIRVNAVRGRIMECVKLGEKVSHQLDGFRLEAVVNLVEK